MPPLKLMCSRDMRFNSISHPFNFDFQCLSHMYLSLVYMYHAGIIYHVSFSSPLSALQDRQTGAPLMPEPESQKRSCQVQAGILLDTQSYPSSSRFHPSTPLSLPLPFSLATKLAVLVVVSLPVSDP